MSGQKVVALLVGVALVAALALLFGGRQGAEAEGARAGSPASVPRSASHAAGRTATARAAPSIRAGRGFGAQSESVKAVVPMPWRGKPHGAGVLVEVGVSYCGGKRPTIDHTTVLERGDRVIATVYVAFPPPRGARSTGCLGAELSLVETLRLSRPLGERTLFDGVRWPPRERWRSGARFRV